MMIPHPVLEKNKEAMRLSQYANQVSEPIHSRRGVTSRPPSSQTNGLARREKGRSPLRRKSSKPGTGRNNDELGRVSMRTHFPTIIGGNSMNSISAREKVARSVIPVGTRPSERAPIPSTSPKRNLRQEFDSGIVSSKSSGPRKLETAHERGRRHRTSEAPRNDRFDYGTTGVRPVRRTMSVDDRRRQHGHTGSSRGDPSGSMSRPSRKSSPERSRPIPRTIGAPASYKEKMKDHSSTTSIRRRRHRSFDDAEDLTRYESERHDNSQDAKLRSTPERGESRRSLNGQRSQDRRKQYAEHPARRTQSDGQLRKDPRQKSTLGSHRTTSSDSMRSQSSNLVSEAVSAALTQNSSRTSGRKTEELEQRIAELVWDKLQTDQSQGGTISTLASSLTDQSILSGKATGPPKQNATIVLTDIQGSTSLWEANAAMMQDALDIHDKILRRHCSFYNGYEIDTEGDAFFLAFHNPTDAFGFALDVQSALYDTAWSKELLSMEAAAEDGCFRGLRVRMGIHGGYVKSCINEVTGRLEYVGETMNIAKCIEGMTHGGQILASFETWNAASYKAEADLNSPQVVDLGSHLIQPKETDDPIAKRIIQLVPSSLSYDYFAARRSSSNDSEGVGVQKGRQFPPPVSDVKLCASFHDAPHKQNEVTIAFVYFSEIEKRYSNPKKVVAAVTRLIGDLLTKRRGYQCQSNMLAFPNVNCAIKFGLRLMDEVKELRVTDDFADLSQMIKFGCMHDTFLTMGPHKTTGRADYFGKVVNRAARITAKSELGSVCFGVLSGESASSLPVLDSSIVCEYKGVKELKGVQESLALYECCREICRAPLGLKSVR